MNKSNKYDAVGVAYFMYNSKYSVIDAGDMAENAAIAIRQVLGSKPEYGWDGLPDWESFLVKYVSEMEERSLHAGSTVSDFKKALRYILKSYPDGKGW